MSAPRIRLAGAPEGFDAVLLAAELGRQTVPLLHVARDDARMARLAEALAFFAPGVTVLQFPAWDCLPYDRVGPNAEITARRVATLARLADADPRTAAGRAIVLTTVNALSQKVPPPETFRGASLTLSRGRRTPPDTLVAFLDSHGYVRAGTVMEPGEYAVRGGLVDLWPAGRDEPVRLDFFGDELDTIRPFDPLSQRSSGVAERLELRPVSEVPLDAESVTRFRETWRELFGVSATEDPLYQAISERRRFDGMEHWVSLFHPGMATLLDYLPGAAVSFDHEADAVLETRLETVAEHFDARRSSQAASVAGGETPYRPVPPARLYLDQASWDRMLAPHALTRLYPFAKTEGQGDEVVDAGARPGKLFADVRAAGANVFDAAAAHAAELAAKGRRVLIAAWTAGSRERLAHLFTEHGFKAIAQVSSIAEAEKLSPATVGLAALALERGFVADRLAVIGEQDILGERISRPARKRKRADQFIAEATELAEGDLVVHLDHGIGRFDGLVTLTVAGAPHDCLKILYDGDDRLFVPVENIEVLSRFGAETQGVALDKLGGASWQARKARLKTRIREMASELIRIAAERQVHQGPVMAPPEGLWDEFCAKFPFAETEDQARAIADVLEDLASGRPMDRLVCGDVGFGKTEVALRAAFVAAMSGAQVAVVVPTTLLARQHFRTFSERFSGLPLRVAQLSRMVGAKDAAAVKAGLADGTVNIVVGTHALLSKTIKFAELGLLIVDEEQHFGVAHKERLKQLKADVHVLTLTATPIPRTLQLALSGVREMSLIATPPVDRLAVRTFITPYDPVVLREALRREKFRGGQVFYVAPRIEDLPHVATRLREIAPEAKIAHAHGRLAPTELERVMTAFGDGQYDILLSTNIVESGLDMPRVNTLVIHRADMFGLSQLYQLRGRVGRGKVRGYAYLTTPSDRKLAASSARRLEVMQTLDTLGAGFTLASHDLDIRGAGNLLGEEQSGHIREVGIELYQTMLEDAVTEARRGGTQPAAEEAFSPQINLGMPVLIPETYVRDLAVRLGLYRRIGALSTDAEIDAFAAELADRFGALPEEVKNLLDIVAIKRLCREAGVERLEAGPKGATVAFRRNVFANPAGLVQWLAKQGGLAKLRPDHRLVLTADLAAPATRLKRTRDLLATLAGMSAPAKAA